MKNVNNFQIAQSLDSGWCLAFAWFFANFIQALLIKMLLIKKASSDNHYTTAPPEDNPKK